MRRVADFFGRLGRTTMIAVAAAIGVVILLAAGYFVVTSLQSRPTNAQVASAPVAGGGSGCPDADKHLEKNEVYQTHRGCTAKGDVEMSSSQSGPWTKLYDDKAETGLLVTCVQEPCWVTTPFGANVTPRTVDDLKAEELRVGCGSSCKEVIVKTWPLDGGSPLAPAPAPPVVRPPVVVTDQCDVSLPKGTKATVPAGCVVSGDVSVNGKVLFDSDQNTGLVVVMKAAAEVFAPYGASVTNADPNDVVNAVKATGCGLPNGCRVVHLVEWPSAP